MSDVKRYDCTNGGRQYCNGCYTMTETPLGDYVSSDDYDALKAEAQARLNGKTVSEGLLRRTIDCIEDFAVKIDYEWGSARSIQQLRDSGDEDALLAIKLRALLDGPAS